MVDNMDKKKNVIKEDDKSVIKSQDSSK